ncbi:glycosyltransferase family 2 protein [Clostridium perfringens]|uniref:glycosyltransferase family 2 protein n=1 Tax=Clostridium perfringens TaxID=1502 RepID=UPI001ABA8B3F|nr:glycosyltransferase family 2 protein [Clostridium perfringens]MBO3365540.1 glycosyltransferase family 2 protein [Clostridium perfringens]MBO3382401.1 glycosyltransferase family 2 protein [Clostridium perfringens]
MKFSVIVPVYNAEKYLGRCIESIQKQSYTNWELILIDDGSNDSSWKIIKDYINMDYRIHGISQKNSGPGIARNVGIEHSNGEYIVFIDADDYIDKDYLLLLAPKAKQNDLVFIDVVQVNSKGKVIRDEKMSIYNEFQKETFLRSMMTGKIPWGGVRKAVSLDLLNKYKIRYTDLKIGEEAQFSFQTVYNANTIGFLSEKPVYMYEVHETSQSTLKIDDPWGDTFETMRNQLIDLNLYNKFATTLNSFNISSTIVSIDRITKYYNGEERRLMIKKRFKTYEKRMDNKYGIELKSLTYKAKVFIPFLKIGWIFPIVLCSKIRTSVNKIKK